VRVQLIFRLCAPNRVSDVSEAAGHRTRKGLHADMSEPLHGTADLLPWWFILCYTVHALRHNAACVVV
jgi:hypothetical protein